jgi:protoheme IX farnesyltransferase
MKTAALPLTRPRLADYADLARPKIAVMVLVTVAAGALLAAGPAVSVLLVLHAVLGTALVACGASALNQWLERDSDACMARTANRPLPSGRLSAGEVLAVGIILAVVGLVYLLLAIPTPGAAILAAISLVGYVAVYTPLKSRTVLNTWVGAVPGALPPLIGFVAVRGELTAEAWALFAVLFLWQIPHFLAIAWMYRDQYAAAGLKMLPGDDPTGRLTAGNMIAWCALLIVASVWPFGLGCAGGLYLTAAILLGWLFLRSTLAFRRTSDRPTARRVLLASLVYLPGLLLAWVIDRGLIWLVN